MVEFDPKRYEPVKHTAMSRAGHALGEGAQRGFFSGLKGFGLSLLVPTAAAVGAGMWYGVAGLGLLGLGAAGLVVGAVCSPLVTLIGTAVGVMGGANHGRERTGKEHMASRYVDGYEAQMAAMQNEVAAAAQQAQMEEMMMRQMLMERQKQAAVQHQPAPAPHTHAPKEHGHAKDHGHGKERPGDKYATASVQSQLEDRPTSKMDASTAENHGRTVGPELAAAR